MRLAGGALVDRCASQVGSLSFGAPRRGISLVDFGTWRGISGEETWHVLGPRLGFNPDITLSDCVVFGETVDNGRRVRGDGFVETGEGLQVCLAD